MSEEIRKIGSEELKQLQEEMTALLPVIKFTILHIS